MPCCVSTLAARSTQTFCDKRPPLRLFHHRLGTRVLATTADAACIVDGDPRYLVPHSTAAKDGQRLPMAGSNTLPHRLHSPHNSLCRAGSHSAIIRPTLYGAHRHPPENAGTSLAGPSQNRIVAPLSVSPCSNRFLDDPNSGRRQPEKLTQRDVWPSPPLPHATTVHNRAIVLHRRPLNNDSRRSCVAKSYGSVKFVRRRGMSSVGSTFRCRAGRRGPSWLRR